MRLLLLFALLATAYATSCINQIQIRKGTAGSYPNEKSIEVNGNQIVAATNAANGFAAFTESACFDVDPTFTIKLRDSYGDGWDGSTIDIVYIPASGPEVKYEGGGSTVADDQNLKVIEWPCPMGHTCSGCDADKFLYDGGCVTECPTTEGMTRSRSTPWSGTDECIGVCDDNTKFFYDGSCVDACPNLSDEIRRTRGTPENTADNCDGGDVCIDSGKFIYNGTCVDTCPIILGYTASRSTPDANSDACDKDRTCVADNKVLHDVDGCVDACPVEEGNYTFSLVHAELITMSTIQHVNVVTSGANTNSLTNIECYEYASQHNSLTWYHSVSYNNKPAGCFVEGATVRHNKNEGSTIECSETFQCLQTDLLGLNEQECQQYAQDVHDDFEVVSEDYRGAYPPGCSLHYGLVLWNQYPWDPSDSTDDYRYSAKECRSSYKCVRKKLFPQPQCTGEKECVVSDEFVLSSTDTCVAECPLVNDEYRQNRTTPDANSDACDGEKRCVTEGQFFYDGSCVTECPTSNGMKKTRGTTGNGEDNCDGGDECVEAGEFIYDGSCVAACPLINGYRHNRSTPNANSDACDGEKICVTEGEFVHNDVCVSECPIINNEYRQDRTTPDANSDACDGTQRCIDNTEFYYFTTESCVSACPSSGQTKSTRSTPGAPGDYCNGPTVCTDDSLFVYEGSCVSACPTDGDLQRTRSPGLTQKQSSNPENSMTQSECQSFATSNVKTFEIVSSASRPTACSMGGDDVVRFNTDWSSSTACSQDNTCLETVETCNGIPVCSNSSLFYITGTTDCIEDCPASTNHIQRLVRSNPDGVSDDCNTVECVFGSTEVNGVTTCDGADLATRAGDVTCQEAAATAKSHGCNSHYENAGCDALKNMYDSKSCCA